MRAPNSYLLWPDGIITTSDGWLVLDSLADLLRSGHLVKRIILK